MFCLLTNQGAARPALLSRDTTLRWVRDCDKLLDARVGRIFCNAFLHQAGCNGRPRVCHLAFRGWGMRWRQLCSRLRILVGSSCLVVWHSYLGFVEVFFCNLKQKRVGSRPTASNLSCSHKKRHPKNAPQFTSPHKKHAGTLITRHQCGCCGTREKNTRSDILAEGLHIDNSLFSLLKWGEINQSQTIKPIS